MTPLQQKLLAFDDTDPDHVQRVKRMLTVKRCTNKEMGRGVFAKIDIPPGSIIGEYKGRLYEGEAAEVISGPYVFLVKTKSCTYAIDAKTNGTITRFINHGNPSWRQTNVRSYLVEDNRVLLVTFKTIKKGQQLLYDYGREYWDSRRAPQQDEKPQSDVVSTEKTG